MSKKVKGNTRLRYFLHRCGFTPILAAWVHT